MFSNIGYFPAFTARHIISTPRTVVSSVGVLTSLSLGLITFKPGLVPSLASVGLAPLSALAISIAALSLLIFAIGQKASSPTGASASTSFTPVPSATSKREEAEQELARLKALRETKTAEFQQGVKGSPARKALAAELVALTTSMRQLEATICQL